MKALQLLGRDRKRRQSGSVLSGLLIIVAMLSILIGALTSELSSSFLLSRTVTSRIGREASVNSAVELSIHQLQTSAVPPVCVRDNRGPWFLTLNGQPTAASQVCEAIVPDAARSLDSRAYPIDGTRDQAGGRNDYLLSDSSGRLMGFRFGSTSPSWSAQLSGTPTGPAATTADTLLVPLSSRSGCAAYCVGLYGYGGGSPDFQCNLPASGPVTARPATETPVGGQSNFDYTFFADTNGDLYVYDLDGRTCSPLATGRAGTPVVGSLLVLPDQVTRHAQTTTTADDVFALATDSGGTKLEQWRYSEAVSSGNCEDGCQTNTLSLLNSVNLSLVPNAIGYAASEPAPSTSLSMTVVVASSAGRLAEARISVTSRLAYTVTVAGSGSVPGGVARAPYWCHCPNGDLIGVGGRNGFLYLLDPNLNLARQYDGQADGRPAIITTPAADANGDWYFGADDGYVYDVEVPASGMQMFKAAKFGPGGAIRSSPVVGGTSDGCAPNVCMYFASSTQGLYFAQLGNARILELRACVTSAPGSANCAANPRLWARLTVGPSAVVGGSGVSVQGWSYYSP